MKVFDRPDGFLPGAEKMVRRCCHCLRHLLTFCVLLLGYILLAARGFQ
jgi:hypothetical protein